MPENDQPSLDRKDCRSAGQRYPPLIAHVLYRFDVGGLETVMIELINALGKDMFRHIVVCLTEDTVFKQRITVPGVEVYALHKRPGKDLGCYLRLWNLFRRHRPDLVQTYNIGTIDAAVPAWLAGIRAIVHSEHGRNADDPTGKNIKYNLLRRLLSPIIGRYVAVSDDLNRWLVEVVRLPARKVVRIYNGVQVDHDLLAGISETQRRDSLPKGFATRASLVFMNVGRLDPVKNQSGLIQAFSYAAGQLGSASQSLRLVIVGDGPESKELKRLIQASGVASQILMTGSRNDIHCLLAAADVFVSSSITEGISMTILEAMACALPVIATAVGGNPEVVVDGKTGLLVHSQEPQELAKAMYRYVDDRELAVRHGIAGRVRLLERFNHERMVDSYIELYGSLIRKDLTQGQVV